MNVTATTPDWLQPAGTTSSTPDIARYLRRTGYAGELAPTRTNLIALAAHHAAAIPFENLNPLLRLPVRLDLPSLESKLLHERRGGYCYEQNLLFAHVLTTLGFRVRGLAARVLWSATGNTRPPRSHMLLLVELDGPYVVDVGFGGLTLTGALRLEPGIEQETPHETFRLMESAGDYTMQANVGGSWRSLYRFDLQPQDIADYEVTNWYLCNHPGSHFLYGLMAARALPDRRYALRNTDFTIHYRNGRSERRRLDTVGEMRQVLDSEFGIEVPAGAAADSALAGVIARGAADTP